MLDVKSIEKLDLKNKTVLVRFDLNLPLDQAGSQINDRLTRIEKTIHHLKELNSKIVILSHLGRPKGVINVDLSLERLSLIHI